MGLTVKGIGKLEPGRYRDKETRGLYLQVGPTGTKSWLFRFELAGRERFMGLGAYPDFSLKEARERARKARQQVTDHIDPIEAKRAERTARALEAARAITFEDAARAYFATQEREWHSRKHRHQFLQTLRDHAFPKIGKLPVAAIDPGLVLKCIEPIWADKHVTASRVRRRIELVLDWATVRGYRAGDNPARWVGFLDKALPKPAKVRSTNHHAALPFAEVPEFLIALRAREGTAARALEFVILTAARAGEVIGARWGEIDLKAKVWTVPAHRMKGRRQHRVPLQDRAVEILRALPREDGNEHVFIGPAKGSGLSGMALRHLLGRMKREDITTHGFRSTFMDWAHERTPFPKVVIDMALAHAVGDKVEAAYRRGDLFEKRKKLMDAWAQYCSTLPTTDESNITPLRRTAHTQ